jgi:hypothetical protein
MGDKVLVTVKGGEVVVHSGGAEVALFVYDDWREGTLEDRRLGLAALEGFEDLIPPWLKEEIEKHAEAWNAEAMHG